MPFVKGGRSVCVVTVMQFILQSSAREENVNFLNVKILFRLSFGFCLEFL